MKWTTAWLLLLIASPAGGFSTHPEITLAREFSPQAATPGQNVTVTLTVTVGAIGSDPLRGFFLADQVPAGLQPGSGSVSLDGNGLSVLRESSALSEVVTGCTSERWTLETPPGWPEGMTVYASSVLVVSYRITVPADAQPGPMTFPGATWVGMQAAQGDAGDHFGHEDLASAIEVLPEGDDWDADGMPNDWEADHGLNPNDAGDAALDPDSDGLSNLQEYQQGTDPHLSDSDGDGLPDGWEVDNGLDPTADDAAADPDVDGYSNLEEYQADTDPQDPDSFPGANLPPEVAASAEPASGDAPLEVTFTGSVADPDGTIATVEWRFGDGDTSTDLNPVHTYQAGGTYQAVLQAIDDQGARSEDRVTILVFEPAPDGGGDEPPDGGAEPLDAGDSQDPGPESGSVHGHCGCAGRSSASLDLLLGLFLVLLSLRRSRISPGPSASSRD